MDFVFQFLQIFILSLSVLLISVDRAGCVEGGNPIDIRPGLDRSQSITGITYRDNQPLKVTYTFTGNSTSINLMHLSVDCGRRPECLAHTSATRTYKLHAERFIMLLKVNNLRLSF